MSRGFETKIRILKIFLILLQLGAYATGSVYFPAIFRIKCAGSSQLWGELVIG